jgi:hypothetical protein
LAATRLEKNEVIYRTKKFQKEKLGWKAGPATTAALYHPNVIYSNTAI